tara:strand:+ start:1061 stop:1453 length:393 start_codon:yes stop_codon:yes gene_type:complete
MINGRKLNENISPNQRRLRLKELSGQKLTNKEKETLKRNICESVSMKQVSKYHDRMVKPPHSIPQPEDDEIDLDEILKEMGYYDDDESEELDDYSEDEIREYIRDIVKERFSDEMELQEIIDELNSDIYE